MNKERKTIFESLISLFSINVVGYVLGFITFPYLTHVLGVERFGAMSLAQSFAGYFLLVTGYAFPLTAPRDISQHKDKNEQKKIFSAIMGAKLFLLLIVSILYFILIYCIPMLYSELWIYVSAYFVLIGDVLFPVWFFQGIEKMRYITYATLLAKSITIVAIFSLVSGPNDTALAAFLQSINTFLAGIATMIFIVVRYRYLFCIPQWKDVIKQLKTGWRFFYSSIAINIYTSGNTFILGIITNNTVVGYFNAALKLANCAKMIIDTASTALFPHTSFLLSQSKNKALLFLNSTQRKLNITGFIVSFIGAVFAESIVEIIMGSSFLEATMMLRILIWLPFIVSFTVVDLNHILFLFGYSSLYSKIVITSAIIDALLVVPSAYYMQGCGVACLTVCIEVYVAFVSRRYAKRAVNM